MKNLSFQRFAERAFLLRIKNEILSNSGCSSFKIDYNNTIVLDCPEKIDKR